MASKIEIRAPENSKAKIPDFLKHPNAMYSELIQVNAITDNVISLYETTFGNELFVIKSKNDIHEKLPENIKERIVQIFDERKFDTKFDEIAVLLPFTPQFRGFIFEIFKKDYAYKYLDELIKSVNNLKVHGYSKGLQTLLVKPQKIF